MGRHTCRRASSITGRFLSSDGLSRWTYYGTVTSNFDGIGFLPSIDLGATPGAAAFYRVRQIPIAQPLDSYGDGIDDVYELRHAGFLNTLDGSDAGQDFDGDGRSNLEEYREGTEPEMP